MAPKECQVMRDDVITLASDMAQPKQNEDNQMTEQNIRDAFEREMRSHGMYELGGQAMERSCEHGGYADDDTNAMWVGYKAGYIAAFKVILESEIDG